MFPKPYNISRKKMMKITTMPLMRRKRKAKTHSLASNSRTAAFVAASETTPPN